MSKVFDHTYGRKREKPHGSEKSWFWSFRKKREKEHMSLGLLYFEYSRDQRPGRQKTWLTLHEILVIPAVEGEREETFQC
jgi:hypothetical protein